jgi:hypothetical protein
MVKMVLIESFYIQKDMGEGHHPPSWGLVMITVAEERGKVVRKK